MTGSLAAERCGPLDPSTRKPSPRLVFVHGFTQTRRSWGHVIDAFADRFETVAVDAPGHGESGDLRLDLPDAADALGRLAGTATYVGYSMGGRLALHLAVSSPAVVERLVLVSSTAGIVDPAARADRRAADETRAAEIERDGVDSFLDRWLALPLFAGLPRGSAGLDERRTNTADGLASSLRLAGNRSAGPAVGSARGADDARAARRGGTRPQVHRDRRRDGRGDPRLDAHDRCGSRSRRPPRTSRRVRRRAS